MTDVIVIGGGAAGVMAAGVAASQGKKVVLLEKNYRTGRKLYITGKGRCNITNDCDPQEFIENVSGNPSFLYSSIYTFTPQNLIELLNTLNLRTKVERGRRVFPASDKSNDVCRTMEWYARNNGVEIRLNTVVSDVLVENNQIIGVKLENGEIISGKSVIIATGGLSYPGTGSTGDGYTFAQRLGHTITKTFPSLTSLTSPDEFIPELEGLSLRNVGVKLMQGKRILHSEMGEMLFTHKGVSGPVILTASRVVGKLEGKSVTLLIDLKPALDEAELDSRLLNDFEKYRNKDYRNALDDLLPQKLIPVFVKQSGIDPFKKVHDITRTERRVILELFKGFTVNINGTGGYNEAVITAGGIKVGEIDPSTMQSKLISGLYFAGEVIDVDAFTGGYNLQIAFSTGYLAGLNA